MIDMYIYIYIYKHIYSVMDIDGQIEDPSKIFKSNDFPPEKSQHRGQHEAALLVGPFHGAAFSVAHLLFTMAPT